MAAKKGAKTAKNTPAARKSRRKIQAAGIPELEGFEIDDDLLDDEEEGGDEEELDDEDDEGADDDGVAVDEDDLPGTGKKRKPRQVRLTDADKIKAFNSGKQGFAEGREVRAWPEGLHPELYNDWSSGWRVAAAEQQQGAGITVYCIFPADLRDIAALEQVYRDRWAANTAGKESVFSVRTSFAALPWDMEQLRGTTWRNIHTGCIATVNSLVVADGWGHPHLAQSRGGSWANERYPSPNGIGLWTDGKYTIEHWVPILDWTPEQEIQWYAKEIGKILDRLASTKADAEDIARNPKQHSCASTNYGLRISEIESYTRDVSRVRAQLQVFAEQHGLLVTPELLNGTRFRRSVERAFAAINTEPARVEQMMLI